MATVISVICDGPAHAEGEEVPAQPYQLTLVGPTWSRPQRIAVDLCEDCAKPLADLAVELTEVGRGFKPGEELVPARKAQPEEEGRAPCPVPGCGKSMKNTDSLRGHVRTMHGLSLAQAEAGESVQTPAPEYPCPVPGCDQVWPTPQARASHFRLGHPEEWQAAKAAEAEAS
jgi:hypothetical protein